MSQGASFYRYANMSRLLCSTLGGMGAAPPPAATVSLPLQGETPA